MRVLIAGSRYWKNKDLVYEELEKIHEGHADGFGKVDVVIEGGCAGGDLCGRRAAQLLGIPTMTFLASWDNFGKAAGPIRNGWMIKFGQPDFALLFTDDIYYSWGTKNMKEQLEKENIPYKVVSGK